MKSFLTLILSHIFNFCVECSNTSMGFAGYKIQEETIEKYKEPVKN